MPLAEPNAPWAPSAFRASDTPPSDSKGKLAERLNIDMETAFTALRAYARAHNRRLSDLARAFIDGTEPLTGLVV
ncbi:ANTAR domain-containing protein [Actinacidiphila oryziradicis]|uniref:ANTAR domain-containing protein n=1 Tax=Actinacidiphila oryziradicis TaxID=2571141 RepID=UPI001FEBAA57|nr:ANTAR domain-containing protein [Actinacidiphila oryziradicis]